MNKIRKFGVAAALVAPFAFGVSAEASAEQQPPVTTPTTTTVYQPAFETPSYQQNYPNPYQQGSQESYSQTDVRGQRNIAIAVSISSVAIAGAIGAAWYFDRRHKPNDLQQESFDVSDIELAPRHSTPIGPEDDPAFWPPRK